MDIRVRLAENQAIAALAPADLTKIYWQGLHISPDDIPPLVDLVQQVILEVNDEGSEL
jgi:hypothetical protein